MVKRLLITGLLLFCSSYSLAQDNNEQTNSATEKPISIVEQKDNIIGPAISQGKADQVLTKNKDPYMTASAFWAYSDGIDVGCKDGKFLVDERYSLTEMEQLYKGVTEPDIPLHCFMARPFSEHFYDTSDECIIARRNAKKSSVCFFNYKKYLPKKSKIDTDEKFLYLVNTFQKIFLAEQRDASYYWDLCELNKEITTSERAQCQKDAMLFLTQIVEDKVPHCRKRVPEEYQKKLEEIAGVEKVSRAMANGFVNEQELNNALYISREHGLALFGLHNFCSTEGYEKDMKKIK